MFEQTDCLISAFCTPFKAGTESRFQDAGPIDYDVLNDMFLNQKAAGFTWCLIAGSTAEPQCMSEPEWQTYLSKAIELCHAAGLKALVGTGTNCTKDSMDKTKFAQDAGADACMLTCPWYNKPSPAMVIKHFNAICKEFPAMPFVLYNIPGRSGINISAETAIAVATANENVVGYKEATENFEQYAALSKGMPGRVALMSGEDGLLVMAMKEFGFKGLISVTANVAAREFKAVHELCCQGEFEKAEAMFSPLLPLVSAMFSEPNPVPVKFGVSQILGGTAEMRSPLQEASEPVKANVTKLLSELNIKSVIDQKDVKRQKMD